MTRFTLATPVTVDGQTHKAFEVRRPKARDLLAAGRESDDPEVREVCLFAWLAGVPRQAIEDLDLYDYRAFQDLYAGFTSAPPVQTGQGRNEPAAEPTA